MDRGWLYTGVGRGSVRNRIETGFRDKVISRIIGKGPGLVHITARRRKMQFQCVDALIAQLGGTDRSETKGARELLQLFQQSRFVWLKLHRIAIRLEP